MGEDHKRVRVEVVADVVEERIDEMGYHARIALPPPPGAERAPMLSELHVCPDALRDLENRGELDAGLERLRAGAVLHDLHEAVGSARGPDTVPCIGSEPRIPHADRAEIIAKVIREYGAKSEERHGPKWLEIMIAQELRTVYADGEEKGAQHERARIADEHRTGRWPLGPLIR